MSDLQTSLATTMAGLPISTRTTVDDLLRTAAVRRRKQSWLLVGATAIGAGLLSALVATKLRQGTPPADSVDLPDSTIQLTDVLPALVGDTWARVAVSLAMFAVVVAFIGWFRRQRVARPIPRWAAASLLVIGTLIVATIGVRLSIQVYYAPSRSMEPTISMDSRFVVAKHDRDAERGDVVVYARSELPLPLDRVARVVGVAGDTVQGRDGQLLVNGMPSTEFPNSIAPPLRDFALTTVPAGSLFVMADNHRMATDSRTEGVISTSDLRGTARWATNGWSD